MKNSTPLALRKLIAFCKKKNILATVQELTFGYERVVLDFTDDIDGFYEMCRWLDRKKRSLTYSTEVPYSPKHFIGWIFVMPLKERGEWMSLCTQDQKRLDDWWRRYRAADDETRRLMACGAIT